MKLLPTKKGLYVLLVCFISGVLLALSFPPFKTWYLVYPGMIVLLHLIFTSDKFWWVFHRGYFTMLVFNALTLYWIAGWSSDDFFLKFGGVATVIIHPLFFLVPILIIYFVQKYFTLKTALILFPLIWTGFEYSHNIGQLAYPWIELGNTETYNLNRIQYAEYIGVHGITFVICVISVILYFLIYNFSLKKWATASKKAVICYIVLLILIIGPNVYSYYYLKNTAHTSKYYTSTDSTKIIKTTMIQANVDPFDKWKLSKKDDIISLYISLLNDALMPSPDLIVMHETAVPYYFFYDPDIQDTQKFIEFVNRNRKYLLMGIPHLEEYPDSNTAPTDSRIMSISRTRYKQFNAAILLEPDRTKPEYQIHKKSKLVPFSENVPYGRYLPFLGKLIKWQVGISSWDFGNGLLVFKMVNTDEKIRTKFSTLICFESVFSDYVSSAVRNGAEFLVIVTNDGWFGKTAGPIQHERFAVLRAIENRKWIVRSAQTGISAFIDPLGNVYDEIAYDTQGIRTREIIANVEITFYAEHGDIIGVVGYYSTGVILLLCILIFAVRVIGRRKT
ncbi:MAG: apolipoprotein N-acyltransferase [Ignavibacteria bacterium]